MTADTLPATSKPQPTAVAKRAYEPYEPIGNVGGLKSLLELNSRSIASILPKHITPERLVKTMLVAANRNPQILDCTQASIIECINRAAELGLDLSGTLGECYPVPFNNKIKVNGEERWVMQCTLIIGYRGMEKLAWQSGEVESIDAEVVYENDKFTFKKGTTVFVEWEPCMRGERGRPIGAYACVAIKGGGKLARFLTHDDIEKIRASAKSKDSPAWRNWWSEMARKCALKRTLKDAPLSTEKYVTAMETDDGDVDITNVLEVQGTARPQSKLQQAAAAAGGKQLPPPTETQGQTDESSAAPRQSPSEGTGESSGNQNTDESKEGDSTAGRQQEGEPKTEQQPQVGGGAEMTPWNKMLITIHEYAESIGKTDVLDKIKDAAEKSLPAKKRKKSETMTAEECGVIVAQAKAASGFFNFLAE